MSPVLFTTPIVLCRPTSDCDSPFFLLLPLFFNLSQKNLWPTFRVSANLDLAATQAAKHISSCTAYLSLRATFSIPASSTLALFRVPNHRGFPIMMAHTGEAARSRDADAKAHVHEQTTISPENQSFDDAIADSEEDDDDTIETRRSTMLSRIQKRNSTSSVLRKVIPFHWAPMLSPLTEADLDACVTLENNAFTEPEHRATREKVSSPVSGPNNYSCSVCSRASVRVSHPEMRWSLLWLVQHLLS